MAGGLVHGELLGTPHNLPNTRLQDLNPGGDVGEYARRNPSPFRTGDEPDADWAVRQLRREIPKVEIWRAEARKAYAFVAGDQVSDADRTVMEANGRPILTFNETRRLIKIVNGIERRVPQTVYYVARNPEDPRAGFKAEQRTKAKEWVDDTCYGTFERARAKNDRVISGMGWTETFISRSKNPAGVINIQRFSPMEAIFPSCSRENLEGTRWRARKRKMPVDAAIQKFPKVADILMAAAGGEGAPKDFPVKADLVKYRVPWVMTEPTNIGSTPPPDPEEINVTDFQYTKGTEGWFFKDPILQQDRWLENKQFIQYSTWLSQRGGGLIKGAEKVVKDVYWRIFLLNDSFVLDGPAKMPIDGFSLNCITYDWDDKRKIWYGMTRVLIDPQLLTDKMASSAVEIMGAQTKGGIDYEQGAMSTEQVKDYRDNNAKPGRAIQFKRNALAEKRVRYPPTPTIPEGTTALLQFGMQSMTQITGLSESLIAPNDSTGVGLRQRLTMGLLLLADCFDSSARYEREQGDTTQKFLALIADDRYVRIGGPGAEQAVQLARDDFDDLLDTTIDDTENDPTLRQFYEERVTQILPYLIKANLLIPELVDFWRLPEQLKQKLKQSFIQKSQMEMQMRQMGMGSGRGKSRTQDEVKADTMKTQSQAALAFAKAQHLKAQASDLSGRAVSEDLSSLMDALMGVQKHDLEVKKLGIERGRAAADIYSTLNPPQTGGK